MKHAHLLLPVLLIIITAAVISCSKSNNSGKPQISIKSITTDIPVGGSLDMRFNVVSGSAKVAGGTFYVVRNRLNQNQLPPGTVSVDTLTGPIPDFQEQNKQEFEYQQDYNYLHQSDVENDTILFRVAVIDVAGKSSDTITTPKIVVHTF